MNSCVDEYINFHFVMNHFVRGSFVPSIPYFYPSIALFFILSFSHLPICPVGCNLKSPSMAHEAWLLITVGSGGVRSVGLLKAKLRKVLKEWTTLSFG